MCTVTFIPAKDKYFITSNRDEKVLRKPALPPKPYNNDNAIIIYPKDADAGGTWIAMHENGNAVVLLNGGFEKHIPAPPYKKSRGMVLLEIIGATKPVEKFHETSFLHIEPFTLVLFENNFLFECRWDGINKHAKELDKSKPHIWSSVTLYSKTIMQKREKWFAEWLNTNSSPSMQEILQFHLFAGDGDDHNDLRMNRDNLMLTVSATCMEINSEKAIMNYLDLNNDKIYKQELRFSSSLTV